MRNTILCVILLLLPACGGFVCATGQDLAALEHRAAVTRAAADTAAAGTLTPPQMAYALECEARAAANLVDAAHRREPRFAGPPTAEPTALPWTPTGGRAK